ncbi:hypothetical protein [Spiroplasma endosymbiont of Ammophila pubescens]|uniref:hypothetical protein n=1 Tax=Spiroplasma endosymbiont of Ammophila pubescens TaxID=3066315 RepID=UPI0032B2A049
MKKISFKNMIQILLVVVLIPPFVMMVVSCSRFEGNYPGGGSGGRYDNQFNFQYGCGNNQNPQADDNSYFHTFFLVIQNLLILLIMKIKTVIHFFMEIVKIYWSVQMIIHA